jgi:hypothetical protein
MYNADVVNKIIKSLKYTMVNSIVNILDVNVIVKFFFVFTVVPYLLKIAIFAKDE